MSESVLEGNTLRISPAIFDEMQRILAGGDGTETSRAIDALKRAGLTNDEITSRELSETKIVVDYTIGGKSDALGLIG
jgi:hypothetical protein